MTLEEFMSSSTDDIRIVVRYVSPRSGFRVRLWKNSDCLATGEASTVQVATKEMIADFDIKMIDSEGRLIC